MGLIDQGEDRRIELKFGSAEALVQGGRAGRQGARASAPSSGMGSARLTAKYGKPELAMTVKGQEFPAYDPRGIQGMGLTYATSNRGACHLRSYTVSSEILGVPEKTDPLTTDGKAGLVKAFQDATSAVDSTGLCVFTTFAWTLNDIAPQVDAAIEGGWTPETMLEAGERIWNLERQFNMRAGFTAKDDSLPPRLLKEAAKTGPAKGLVSGLDKMLPEYYQLRGWTKDGVPTNETMARLGRVSPRWRTGCDISWPLPCSPRRRARSPPLSEVRDDLARSRMDAATATVSGASRYQARGGATGRLARLRR